MAKQTDIQGQLREFSEMGGRGTPVWTVSAENNLYRLKTGDVLTVFSDAARKNVVWQGTLDLVSSGEKYPAPNLTQAGISLHDWRKLFSSGYPVDAKLKNKEKLSF